MTTWLSVLTETDVRFLEESFGHFRNSILRECKYGSGIFVDEGLSLHLGYLSFLRCLFQSQHSRLPAVELVFCNIQALNILPDPENAFEEAFVRLDNGQVVWSELKSEGAGNFIKAESLRWRPMEAWLGKRERYSGVVETDLDYYDPEPSLGPLTAIKEAPKSL